MLTHPLNRFALALTLLSIATVPLAALPSMVFAQAVSPSVPRDLSRLRTEFARVQTRMEAVQRDFDRAERTNAPPVREAALKDWQRALDGLEPYVKALSPDDVDAKPFIDQYAQWRDLYNKAAGEGNAGEFFLQTTRDWAQMTAGTQDWEKEDAPLSFDALVKADANDAKANALGLPQTVAFIKKAKSYLANVAAREDYEKFKSAPNVMIDHAQVLAAIERAQEKFAHAAEAATNGAISLKLDPTRRDRLERLDEDVIAPALEGYESQPALLARGRAAVYAYDKVALGDTEASKRSVARLTAAAERSWPGILAMYQAQPMAAPGAGRGQIVTIHNAQNRVGQEFAGGGYDFAGFIDNAAVVGKYAPGVREKIVATLALTNLDALPADATYELVAVVRGTAQVPAVRQRPNATTAPATADDATATTSPATTNCVLLDIVAVKAGPVAVGTPVVVTPER